MVKKEELLMKKEFLRKSTKIQQAGTNFFTTIPSAVRSVLKPEKGDLVEFIIYNDHTVEIKIVKG